MRVVKELRPKPIAAAGKRTQYLSFNLGGFVPSPC